MNRGFVFAFTTLFFLFVSCGNKQGSNVLMQSDATENAVLNKPVGSMFRVADVETAPNMLKMLGSKKSFENRIGKSILFYPEEHMGIKVVPCSNNGLIETVQECYDNHRPLLLTPDLIWLAICQGVSIHVNENFKLLKNKIFVANKPDVLVVRNDSLEKDGAEWGHLIGVFSQEAKKYVKSGTYEFFNAEFSTTSSIEQTAYQTTMLECFKKGFKYVAESGCGIPSITIAGTEVDWQLLLKKLEVLDRFGLSEWKHELKPLIREFIMASNGVVHQEFWQNIYKNASEYNAFYISGWIIKLFPYIVEKENSGEFNNETQETKIGEYYRPNEFLKGDDYLVSTLSTDNFPSGIARIPVTWKNYFKNETRSMEVYAGFFAIRQFNDKCLMPLISWAVCDKEASDLEKESTLFPIQDLEHQLDYWSPHFVATPVDSAIYDIKRFQTQSASLNFVSQTVRSAVAKNKKFKSFDLSSDTLDVEVLCNGTLRNIELKHHKKDVALNAFVRGVLNGLPAKWFPALAHPRDVLEIDIADEENEAKVRVNSRVEIPL